MLELGCKRVLEFRLRTIVSVEDALGELEVIGNVAFFVRKPGFDKEIDMNSVNLTGLLL
jgi:hypothetical protein